MTNRIWFCFVPPNEEFGRRIRAWTDDQKRAEGFRAEGLDMVEFVRSDAARSSTQALRRALLRVRLWVEAIRDQIEADTKQPAMGCRQTIDEIDEAVNGADSDRPTHRHLKSGRLYRVIGRGLIEADLSDVVIYEGPGGSLWVRPSAEFDDGRFAKLPS